MQKATSFSVSIVLTMVLGLAAAVVAALGITSWAIALGGLGLAALAASILLLERRIRATARQTRRSADQTRSAVNRIAGTVGRLEALVDATQRRVVASVESARVEAAERHRASTNAE
jgi:membrane protein implicated in regulation of membrane protease activity